MTEETKPVVDVVPYCGGCGHLYFNEPMLTLAEAKEKAKTRRCHYCIEDAIEDAKRPARPYRPDPEPDDHWSSDWGNNY